jgi:4-hydroxy-tetrahydrodipicolinate reductase
MKKIKVMVNGIPGNVSVVIAKHIVNDDRLELIPCSLTGPEIETSEFHLDDLPIRLLQPAIRDKAVLEIKETQGDFISVDYTHPSAVNANAGFYCANGLPFIMGTTGGDRRQLEEIVLSSGIAAVIAPNMAKQIVGFQAMMEYAANNFPDLFAGYTLQVRESHQKGKADTSGTAKTMVKYFNQLGVDFSVEEIIKERDPHIQKTQWGIPEAYLTGHGWHTYDLVSQDKTVKFSFTHNINGREIYASGTIDAILYLNQKVDENAHGRVYTMIDVLKGK